MNKNIFCCFIFICTILTTYTASSQAVTMIAKTDSLRQEINNKEGFDKIAAQLELAQFIIDTDTKEARRIINSVLPAVKKGKKLDLEMRCYYILGRVNYLLDNNELSIADYDSALIISEAIRDNWYKGEILYRLGAIKRNLGKEAEALEYLNASLQACRLSDNFKTMGASYSLMGTIFRVNGIYDRAIEYIVNSRLYYEKAGLLEGNAWASYLLGRIYADLKLPQKALEYFQQAVEIYTKQAAEDGNKNGVAICYEQIGLLKLSSGDFEEALKFIDNTLKIYTKNNSELGISNSHKNLGMISYSMGNYDLSEKYLEESLKVKKEIGDLLSLPTIYEYLGLCLIGKKQMNEGFNYLHQGLNIAISNNQLKLQLNIYSELTKAYLSVNDLKNAISCQEKQIEIQDLILTGAANIKIEQLQTIYEIDKQNGQITELEKQNEINSLKIKQNKISQQIMIIGILLVFIFSLTIIWFYTKIRLKNLELKETNAAKDKFFAIIAHDLRGPTGNLASFLEHINSTFNELSPEELKRLLLSLYKSAENVSVLLENLLLWARSQLNKIEINPTELALSDVLQFSIKGLKQTADNKQIDIRLELDEQIHVMADPDMMQSIVRNILSNAIKFTPRGGSVIIKSSYMNISTAIISITDNGVGIEKSALSKIFDLTSTVQTNGTEGEKSTGLGLILAKDFIDKNNGTIEIQSQKDKGTSVSFTLPSSRTPFK